VTIEAEITAALTPVAPTTPFSMASPNARPRITYQKVTSVSNESFSGEGPVRARMQIDVWADTYKQAHVLAESAKVALRAGLNVGAISDNPDDYEADTKLHRASFDVAIWPTIGETP
jgi:hypothetical protein